MISAENDSFVTEFLEILDIFSNFSLYPCKYSFEMIHKQKLVGIIKLPYGIKKLDFFNYYENIKHNDEYVLFPVE